MWVQAKKTFNFTEDGEILLTLVNRAWMCRYSVSAIQDYAWKEKNGVPQDETLKKRYADRIFGPAFLGRQRRQHLVL